MFSTLDILIFGAFLLLSMLVGIYHGVMSKIRTQKHTKTAEFLTGGRKLPILPVVLSLLTTFISGIALLAMPSEIYLRGFGVGISYIMNGISFLIIGVFFIPIFYKLQFLNAYEYFEMRFDSLLLRKIGTLIFLINTLIYLAVVIYAPSVALAGVTNVPLWPFILGVGLVGTIYTSAGGIKGVIWTDTLQAVFLYVGLATLIIKATINSGGFLKVLEINEDTGRLTKSMAKFDPTLLQYNSFWIAQLGGVLHWISIYGLNQMALQRYCSMPSLREAKIVLWLTIPAAICLSLMTSYIGLLLVAYFNGCDPLAIGEIQTPDQMTILMAVRVLSNIPGLSGLFLSTLFSATLSTVSSGLNSMTAVLWEDFLKHPTRNLKDKSNEIGIKLITILFGVIATLMAFACHNLGGIFQIVITVLGASTGPLVGLFFLGVFFPMANRNGALTGLIVSAAIMICCAIMNNIDKPYVRYVLAEGTNETSEGCINYPLNEQSIYDERQHLYFSLKDSDLHFGEPEASFLAKISPYCYSSAGVFIVILVAIPISFLFPQKLSAERKKLCQACTYKGLKIPVDKPIYLNRNKLLSEQNNSSVKQLIQEISSSKT